LSSAGLEDARRFRTDFGLRSDDGWILAVAGDPASDRTTYGVPLTAEEVTELGRRAHDVDQIVPIVVAYGEAHPAQWAGAYIDPASNSVVGLFTGDLELHRLAIFAQVWPKAGVEVRQVARSKTELEAAKARVHDDEAWLSTIPAVVVSLGINIELNRLEARLSSPNPLATRLVLSHFGWDESLLQVSSDGTGARLLAPSALTVKVADVAGTPKPGLACIAYPDVPGATDPRPDPLPLTNASGECELGLRATGYWIEIERPSEPFHVLGTTRVVLRPAESLSVELTVPG
jgi:hypothetical protein